MLKPERQSLILHQLNIHNRVLSSDLSQQLKVSEDTIRRDLNELADLGKLVKDYGIKIAIHNHGPEDKLWRRPEWILKAVSGLD